MYPERNRLGAGDTPRAAGDALVTSCSVDFVGLSAPGRCRIKLCNGWKVEEVDIFRSKSPRICSANPPGVVEWLGSCWMDHRARPRKSINLQLYLFKLILLIKILRFVVCRWK